MKAQGEESSDDVMGAYKAVCAAAGTDTEWLDCIGGVDDPWRHWLRAVRFPSNPMNAWLETHVRDVFRAADAHRLAINATNRTKHFVAIWDAFRKAHVELDERGKYRRNRYWIWRGAVLKMSYEKRGCFLHGRGFYFQDMIDATLCRNKLAEAMANASGIGTCNLDGSSTHGYGNFWKPCWAENADGTRTSLPIHDYTAMVLSLVRAVT